MIKASKKRKAPKEDPEKEEKPEAAPLGFVVWTSSRDGLLGTLHKISVGSMLTAQDSHQAQGLGSYFVLSSMVGFVVSIDGSRLRPYL